MKSNVLVVALALMSLAIGCIWERGRTKYELSNGRMVECFDFEMLPCGMTLKRCKDFQIYRCQTGVREVWEKRN